MTVGSIIGGGFRLVREQPKAVAIWAVLVMLASLLGVALLAPLFVDVARARAAEAAGAALPGVHLRVLGWGVLLDVVLACFYVVIFAAAVRAVARIGSDRVGYLRVGGDELRLVGLGLILLVAAILIEIALVIGFILIGLVLTLVAGKGAEAFILAILGLIAFGAAIWAEVRLSLAGVLTVLRGRIAIKEAWQLTHGRFWQLFGAYLLLFIGFVLISLALTAAISPHLTAAYLSFDQPTIMAAAQEQAARQMAHPIVTLLPQILVGGIVTGILFAIFAGAATTAALELEAERGTPAAEPAPGTGPWH